MGRGLSDLQQTILTLALDNRRTGKHAAVFVTDDLYACEILAAYFGWDPEPGWNGEPKPLGPFRPHFSMDRIGERSYRAATAAVSRSLSRLKRRGLVRSRLDGISLTDAGLQQAEALQHRPENPRDDHQRTGRESDAVAR